MITGASKGIGTGIAKSLAAEGASVVVNYASSKAGAESVVAAITKAGGKAVAVGGDITKAAEAQGLIDAAIKAYGHLDIQKDPVFLCPNVIFSSDKAWSKFPAAARSAVFCHASKISLASDRLRFFVDFGTHRR